MARLRFRITTIALDEEEDVSEVTAVVDGDTHRLISEVLDSVTTTDTRRGGTETTIVLPVSDALELFDWCGKRNGLDEGWASSSEIWRSLSTVVYGLIEGE